jgi:integrase/recombinase XerD
MYINNVIKPNNELITCFEAFISDRHAQNLSEGTIRFYREKIKLFFDYVNPLGVSSILDLTPQIIRDFLIHLEQANHNPGGVHAAYRSLKAFLNWWKNEYEPENWKNPIDKVKPPKVPVVILEPIQPENALLLLTSCNKKTILGLRDYAILLTLMDTGIRAAELLSITRMDLDLKDRRILIRKGKGNKFRVVFISDITCDSIQSYLNKRSDNFPQLWITNIKSRLKYPGLREIMRRRAKDSNIKTPSLHGFRRYFALQMLRSGVDVFSLQKLMGHSDIQILRRYLQQTEEDIRLAHNLGGPVDHLLVKEAGK